VVQRYFVEYCNGLIDMIDMEKSTFLVKPDIKTTTWQQDSWMGIDSAAEGQPKSAFSANR
jgi:hypothetical protein